jgi:phage-related tail protein
MEILILFFALALASSSSSPAAARTSGKPRTTFDDGADASDYLRAASAGAALGTAITPGVGTAIGAAVGAGATYLEAHWNDVKEWWDS